MPITLQDSGKWLCRLQIPTSELDSSGYRKYRGIRKSFDTKGAAEAWEKKQRGQYVTSGRDSTLNLMQIAEYQEAKRLAGGNDLRHIVKYWNDHNPTSGQLSASKAIEEYKASPKWASFAATTQRSKTHHLSKFEAVFGKKHLTEIVVDDVESYLDKYNEPVTRNTHLRTLKAFFKWCTSRRVRYINVNPIDVIESQAEDFDVPRFMKLEDVQSVMNKAAETDTGMIPLLALGFFAGLRPSEILRLEKRDFLFEDKRINVRGEVAKRKRAGKPLARLIEGLPTTLWEWLSAVKFDGVIDVKNYVPRRREIYSQAGVESFNSAARHTFATYAYALYDAGKIRKWTGHRNSDSILLTHYAGLEEKSRGTKYFKIKPPKTLLPTKKPTNKYAGPAKWPDDKELARMVRKSSKSAVARELGVSETSVRKRLKRKS